MNELPLIGEAIRAELKRQGRSNVWLAHQLSCNPRTVSKIFQNYKTYLSARKQITLGRVFTPIFYTSLGLSTIFYLVGAGKALLVTLPVASVSCPVMCIFKGVGKGRMNWVADDYNRKHNMVSYAISPSFVQVNLPGSQANVIPGMTFSVTF